ncbi:hypothetical protein niasHT_002309 [Heterodera trifolii]|uniref:Uncharacterized protein n=1 Tax=Heterodera trifolii TaxID=157864 RepID=A0ABD2LNE3_9BILA
MEHLAACHLMNGFFRVPHSGSSRRGQHASAPSCQHVKRSLSLADRRGLISPARGNARGFISANAGAARAGGTAKDDEWKELARRMHHAEHSLGQMQNWGFLMPILNANCSLRFPTLEFGAKSGYYESIRRRGNSSEEAFGRHSESQEHQLGHVLVRLLYSHHRLSVSVLCVFGFHGASALSLLVWLLRADQGKLEKRNTAEVTLRNGSAMALNEQWEFKAQPKELDRMAVAIMVMDSFGEVGHCILGDLSGADATGAHQWHEAIDRPGQGVTEWHSLSANW